MIRLMSYTHINFYYELHKVVDEMRHGTPDGRLRG